MDDTYLTILSGILTAVLATGGWIGRRMWLSREQQKKSLSLVIAEARRLLKADISIHEFERSDAYHQLRPHLSPEVRRFIDTRNARPDKDGVIRVIVLKRGMDWAHRVRDDLARLEKRMGLLPWAYTTDE